jgi:hypothetical protein
MLKVASFSITDADGVNELLSKYRLAEGANILVSDGHIMVPFLDGAEPTKEQKIVDIREEINKMNTQIGLLNHSQSILNFLKEDAQNRIDTAVEDVRAAQSFFEVQEKKSPEKKEAGAKIDECNKRVEASKRAFNELNNQVLMNDHEILRLQINIEKFEENITKL